MSLSYAVSHPTLSFHVNLKTVVNSWLWPIHAKYETDIAIGYPHLCAQKKRFYAAHQLTIMSPSL